MSKSRETLAAKILGLKNEIAAKKEKLEYYRKVFDKLPVAVFICCTTTKEVQWLSEGISIMWGEIPVKAKSYNAVFKRIVHADDYDRLISEVCKPFDTTENRNTLFRVNNRNMNTVWYLSVTVPFKTDSHGNTTQTLSVALDIDNVILKNAQLEQSAKDISKELNNLKFEHLTTKETKILELLGKGNSIKQIAEIQNRSLHTIENHKRKIYSKLGVSKIIDMVQFAADNGIINIQS